MDDVAAVRSVKLATGVRLQYVERGDPSGLPMLLLHGVTDSWRSFEPVLPHLSRDIRALALTQRGHGDSERPPQGYRARDFAADIAAFGDALGPGPAGGAGHSMGSTNAQCFALDWPQRTRGLVLVASFGGYRNNPAVTELWESGVSRLADPIDPAFIREFQQGTVAGPVPP